MTRIGTFYMQFPINNAGLSIRPYRGSRYTNLLHASINISSTTLQSRSFRRTVLHVRHAGDLKSQTSLRITLRRRLSKQLHIRLRRTGAAPPPPLALRRPGRDGRSVNFVQWNHDRTEAGLSVATELAAHARHPAIVAFVVGA